MGNAGAGLGHFRASDSAFFESPSHLQQVLDYLDEGFLPLKYAYAGSSAFTHARLAGTAGYKTVIGQCDHEVEALVTSLPLPTPHQIVDIGPGTGEHSATFILRLYQELRRRRALRETRAQWASPRYLGLDFSTTLLDIAAPRIVDGLGTISGFPAIGRSTGKPPPGRVTTAQWDVESGYTPTIEAWRQGDDPILICMLGHTLGNLEDPLQSLRNLALSSRPGDVLLIAVTLSPQGFDEGDDYEVLHSYDNKIFANAVLEPWRAAGICEEDVNFHLSLADRSVIGEVVFENPVTVAGHHYSQGTAIRCFTSARFLVQEVIGFLAQSGWNVLHRVVDKGSDHLALVATL